MVDGCADVPRPTPRPVMTRITARSLLASGIASLFASAAIAAVPAYDTIELQARSGCAPSTRAFSATKCARSSSTGNASASAGPLPKSVPSRKSPGCMRSASTFTGK